MLVRSNRHPALLRHEDALLVVVDMQEPFLRHIHERERLIAQVTLLLQASVILRVPVVPTLQYEEKMGNVIPEIAKKFPAQCVPFDKLSFSCAGSESFLSEIKRSGRRQIMLCGVETHICVSQTAHDLITLGYQVHILNDATSSRSESNSQAGLRKMAQAGTIMSSVETAIYEMMVEAGTPEFRQINNLLK